MVLVFLWCKDLDSTVSQASLRNDRFMSLVDLLRVVIQEIVSGAGVLHSEVLLGEVGCFCITRLISRVIL